jgi:hypothetical protein
LTITKNILNTCWTFLYLAASCHHYRRQATALDIRLTHAATQDLCLYGLRRRLRSWISHSGIHYKDHQILMPPVFPLRHICKDFSIYNLFTDIQYFNFKAGLYSTCIWYTVTWINLKTFFSCTGCPKTYVTLLIIYNFIKPKAIAKIFCQHIVHQHKFYLTKFGKILYNSQVIMTP